MRLNPAAVRFSLHCVSPEGILTTVDLWILCSSIEDLPLEVVVNVEELARPHTDPSVHDRIVNSVTQVADFCGIKLLEDPKQQLAVQFGLPDAATAEFSILAGGALLSSRTSKRAPRPPSPGQTNEVDPDGATSRQRKKYNKFLALPEREQLLELIRRFIDVAGLDMSMIGQTGGGGERMS